MILTENAFDHYDRSYNMKNMTHEKRYHDIFDFYHKILLV